MRIGCSVGAFILEKCLFKPTDLPLIHSLIFLPIAPTLPSIHGCHQPGAQHRNRRCSDEPSTCARCRETHGDAQLLLSPTAGAPTKLRRGVPVLLLSCVAPLRLQ